MKYEEEGGKRIEKANLAFPDTLVQNYKGLIGHLELADKDDRYVLHALL